MIRNAKEVILALDNTKLDKVSFVQIASLDKIQTVVTSDKPNKEWRNHFDSLGITCKYPK